MIAFAKRKSKLIVVSKNSAYQKIIHSSRNRLRVSSHLQALVYQRSTDSPRIQKQVCGFESASGRVRSPYISVTHRCQHTAAADQRRFPVTTKGRPPRRGYANATSQDENLATRLQSTTAIQYQDAGGNVSTKPVIGRLE